MGENQNIAERGKEKGAGRERLFYPDLIRVLSTLLIVIYHFPLALDGTTDWLHATRSGRWGVAVVYVFFMLSGAMLFYRYGETADFSVKQYLKRRVLTLYPLFYLAYLGGFFYVFWVLGRTYDVIPTGAIIWSILGIDGYLNNIVPTFTMVGEWFLGAILLVYLCFPLLRLLARRIGRGALTLTALGPTLLIFWRNPTALMEPKQNLLVDLFFFLLGAWVSGYYGRLRPAAKEIAGAVSCAGLLLWIFAPSPPAFLFPGAGGHGMMPMPEAAGDFFQNGRDLVGALLLYVSLMWAGRRMERMERLTNFRRAVAKCGQYTYGVFLVHHLAENQICAHFQTAEFGNRNTLVLLLLCLCAVIFFTWLLYRVRDEIARFFAAGRAEKEAL